ncbi:MAG: fatty acid desaturase, partial [Pseudomonadota bacterium]
LPASCSRSTPMICASLNLLFFTSVSLDDGLSLKPRDQEGGRSIAHLPVVSLAAAIGVGLFYVQHQFEGSRWMRQDGWNPTASALEGSSHLVLPQPLRWLTANIGAHHLHHASSRIPFYRLPKAMAAHPSLATACRLHIRDLGPALSLALWDEIGGRMVTFREARLSR